MLICDCHCDTLYKLQEGERDNNDISLDILNKAGVSLQTMAMYIGTDPRQDVVDLKIKRMLEEFEALKASGAKQALSPSEASENETKLMLSIEGGEAYQEGFDLIDFFYEKGVRMMSLTWNFNNKLAYCHKADKSLGLTVLGVQMVKKMQDKKIAVDVSHLNEQGFFDIFLKTNKAPMASHSCAKSLCNNSRNLSDEQLKLLFKEGGFVGLNFYPAFLEEEGKCGLQSLARHIEHMYQLGGKGRVGLGSDFDGIETKPEGLKNPLDLKNLFEALLSFGFSSGDVEDIAGLALINYYKRL